MLIHITGYAALVCRSTAFPLFTLIHYFNYVSRNCIVTNRVDFIQRVNKMCYMEDVGMELASIADTVKDSDGSSGSIRVLVSIEDTSS